MFKPADKTEINQISLTGVRAIVLIGLLIVAPRTLEEIRRTFIDLNIMDESHSNDILRIDINTIKAMGCEISRASAKTGYKYILGKHPFALKIDNDELNVLKKVYKKVKESKNLQLLIDYDNLFKKIAEKCEPGTKELILGISVLKYYDIQLVKDLILDCQKLNVLNLEYHNPTSKKDSLKEVVAQKLVLQNDKLYLYCYDSDKKSSRILSLKRIKSILSRKFKKEGVETKYVKVKFHLKELGIETISEDESIIERDKDGIIVEGTYYNEFIAIQRILSFGSDCTVLEPDEFKGIIINKLKEMRRLYDC